MKNLFLILSIASLSLISCNKDEPENTCLNGIVDEGETGVDCGGPCAPCANNTTPFVLANINNQDVSFKNKDLVLDGNSWTMTASNDSISLIIKYNSNGEVGSYPFEAGSNLTYLGESYSFFSDDGLSISENNSNTNTIDGFFSAIFQNASGESINLYSGVYGDMSY